MKTLRHFFTSLFAGALFLANVNAQPSPVESILLDPQYPVINQPLTIYVNANYFGLTTDNDQLSAWTGLNTSKGNWQHNPIAGNWPNESIALNRVADVNNDSVFQLVIPSIASFYNVNPETEAVFQIDFIARGHAGAALSGQSSDLLFEVFYLDVADTAVQATPALPNEYEKAVVTFNINKAGKTLAAAIAANPNDSVFIYTAANSNLGDWKHEVSPWGSVGSNSDLKLMRVSDSIYRFYYDPSPRDFYNVTLPVEALTQLNFVIRNGNGSSQTENQYVPLDVQPISVDMSQAVNGLLCYPTYPTVNDHIFIFIDAKAYYKNDGTTQLNPASTFTAWTGLTTSAGAWQHQVNGGEWSNISGDSVQFTRLNDSVQYWDIPSIADKYNVKTNEEEVFQIVLIARDTVTGGAIGKETENELFEIYGGQPASLLGVQPASPDAFKPMVLTYNNNAEGGMEGYSDTIYAHTGVFIPGGTDWSYVKSAWPNHEAASRCLQINDSIYRFFIFPSIREFYGVDDSIKVDSVVIIFHNIEGVAPQSSTLFIPVSDTTTPVVINGIDENSLTNSSINVYPNPATDMVTIDLSKTKASTVNFYTLSGQLVHSENVSGKQSLSINVAAIAENGNVLIYQVITETGTVQGKLLVK